MDILTIENLNKRYGSVEALSDLSLNVESGCVMGLLGPNGAGKTTLLRIINGILAKDSGSVRINDKDITLQTARNIGYLPEERGLYDNMTVENQIIYWGELKGGDKKQIRKVMQEYLAFFNLEGSEHRRIRELSKGNQQKVQIISSIVHEPELVILDEPFSGFDPINGELLKQLIENMHAKGVTVVVSSHNMHAVEILCDKIALLNKGKLLISGAIDDIKDANKTDEINMTTSSCISKVQLLESGTVEWIRDSEYKFGRSGFSYRMKKTAGTINSEILREVLLQSDILQFEEALPSLQEIFIKYTTSE